jgi:hypothetical protein
MRSQLPQVHVLEGENCLEMWVLKVVANVVVVFDQRFQFKQYWNLRNLPDMMYIAPDYCTVSVYSNNECY